MNVRRVNPNIIGAVLNNVDLGRSQLTRITTTSATTTTVSGTDKKKKRSTRRPPP